MGKLKKYSKEYHRQSNISFKYFYKHLSQIVVNMFNWEELPAGVSSRFIERALIEDGFILYTEKNSIPRFTRGVAYGINPYEEPIKYQAISVDGSEKEILTPYVNCIPIFNDIDFSSSIPDINYFATKLNAVDKTINENLEHLKNPYIIGCSEGARLTLENILKQKTEGVPYILCDENMSGISQLSLFNTNPHDFTGSLHETKTNIKNDFLTHFGINNVNIFKRERLTSGENESNNDEIMINRNNRLLPRQKALKEIEKLYGKKYEVTYNGGVDLDVE